MPRSKRAQSRRNPHKHAVELVDAIIRSESRSHLFGLCTQASIRGIHNPDFRLPRSLGNGFEPDQKHVIQAHEPLANFPSFGGRLAYRVRSLLQFVFE